MRSARLAWPCRPSTSRGKTVRDVNSTGQAAPTFLTIGHASRDLVPGGWRWGGTVTYAALLARTWGVPPAVLTALAPEDVPRYQEFLGSDAMLHTLPSKNTTSIENVYTATGRRQQLAAKASKIHPRHVPAAWRATPTVLVAPLVGEVSTQFGSYFPQGSLVAMTIQGRLRSHRKGRMYTRRWHRAEQEFSAYDIIFFSEEDVRGNAELAEYYASLVPLAVMTQGNSGATVFVQGRAMECTAFPAQPVDATGAGDVFAAVFLLHYAEVRDAATSCRYANAAAAYSIEHVGASGIPTRQQVEARLQSVIR